MARSLIHILATALVIHCAACESGTITKAGGEEGSGEDSLLPPEYPGLDPEQNGDLDAEIDQVNYTPELVANYGSALVPYAVGWLNFYKQFVYPQVTPTYPCYQPERSWYLVGARDVYGNPYPYGVIYTGRWAYLTVRDANACTTFGNLLYWAAAYTFELFQIGDHGGYGYFTSTASYLADQYYQPY